MTPIEKMMNDVDFKPTNNKQIITDMPYVTHEGILNFGDVEITVCQLNTGERIIPNDEIEKLLKL